MKLCENSAALELTASMIEKKREPHSIMICGERGLGKKTIAKAIAAQLLCEAGDGAACGKCRSCRLIENNAHPDLVVASASETGNYKADDIRALVTEAYTSPSEGRFRIFLIPDLDRSVQTLTQIQNIMLKLIEEPPDTSVIILTARSKEVFLDTIISRTVHLNAEEVTPAAAMAHLIENGADKLSAEEAVRRCGGNIGKCLQYISDEKLRELAVRAENAMRALAERDEYALLMELSLIDGKRDQFIAAVNFMQRIVRDACRIRAGAEPPMLFSAQVCRALSAHINTRHLSEIYDILGDFADRAAANCLIPVLANALTAKLAE